MNASNFNKLADWFIKYFYLVIGTQRDATTTNVYKQTVFPKITFDEKLKIVFFLLTQTLYLKRATMQKI